MKATLHYVHDPMCSWCYAYAPVWAQVQAQLPAAIGRRRWLGGLAPDTDEPMPASMRQHLQATWRRIETVVPGTRFNFEFWDRCQPRRATYPACRAVIAARDQGADFDTAMTMSIQRAYYQQARNPSDHDTLIELAGELGLDVVRFEARLNAPETQAELWGEMETARALGVSGFPGLVLQTDAGFRSVPIDYRSTRPVLEMVDAVLR